MAIRKVVHIDEEKCNGCGLCVPNCAEKAIQIIDGKAKLVSDIYCDGLGACLGACPMDAITIEEREADAFDESKTLEHIRRVEEAQRAAESADATAELPSLLTHWPVKLQLVPPTAPYFQDADLLLAADCAPIAHGDFHRQFMKAAPVVIGCPKLNDAQIQYQKLVDILRESSIRSLTVAHMQVPCCHKYERMAQTAIVESGKDLPLRVIVVGVRGEILSNTQTWPAQESA